MHYYLTCTHAWIHKETNKVIKHAVVVRLLKSFYHPLTGFRWFCQTKLFQERPSESPIDPQGKKSYSTNVAKEGGCVVSGNNIAAKTSLSRDTARAIPTAPLRPE